MKRIGFIDGRRVAGWSFPATATPGNGQVMNITDPSTPASGIRRGAYINYTQSGVKTGSAEVDAFAIDLALNAAVPTAYGQAIYLSSSGDPTIAFVSGLSFYIDNLGSGLSGFAAIDIGLALSDAPPTRHCFMRLRNHVGTIVADGIRIEGSNPITNLLYFLTATQPIISAAVGGAQNQKIRISIAGTPYYIPLHTA